jgi:hypothetical protein
MLSRLMMASRRRTMARGDDEHLMQTPQHDPAQPPVEPEPEEDLPEPEPEEKKEPE